MHTKIKIFRTALSIITLLSMVLFPTAAVLAKQADCLVAESRKTYIDGTCEFNTTDAVGSFTLSSGTIEVKLMADPGAKSGRAFYTDSSGGEPWVTNVKRDGACWKAKDLQICAWSGSRPDRSNTTTSQSRTPVDKVRDFYKKYFTVLANGDNTPEIDMSNALKSEIKKSAEFCKKHADGPCGWGADSDPYLNSQDPDSYLNFKNSGISFTEISPNTVRVVLNVNPSIPQGTKNTIIFKMVNENKQWVVDDIVYPEEGGSAYSSREALATERNSTVKTKAN